VTRGKRKLVKLNKTDEAVVAALRKAGKGLTLAEIADASGEAPKKVFKSSRPIAEMFKGNNIETRIEWPSQDC